MFYTSGNKAQCIQYKQQLLTLSHSNVPTAMGNIDWSNYAIFILHNNKMEKEKEF